MKPAYHAARVMFGAWFLFSGAWHFLWPWLQPMGTTPAAVAFTRALLASGLFGWVKAIEVVAGLLILVDRGMPLTIIAVSVLNVVILYWNLVLDRGLIDWIFALLTVLCNAILAWPWRSCFWPLFLWKGRPDFSRDWLLGPPSVPPA